MISQEPRAPAPPPRHSRTASAAGRACLADTRSPRCAQVIFRDVSLYNKMMLEQMHVKVDALGRLVLATSLELQRLKQRGASVAADAPPGDSSAVPADAPKAPATASDSVAEGWAALLQQPAPGAASGARAPAAPAAAPPPKQSNRVMNIVWFFGVYAFFKYLVDKDG